MRVVFLTHNYPRGDGDIAGAFLRPLAGALAARGHDVRVVAPSDGGRGGQERLDGIAVLRVRYASPARERYAYTGRMLEAVRSPGGWLAIAGMVRAMRAAVREQLNGARDAVVHAHWWFPAGLAAPRERPCVVTLHGTDARLLRNPVARLLARRALAAPRIVTAVSRSVARQAEAAGLASIDDRHVSPMPVLGPGRRAGSDSTPPAAGSNARLIFVGRLTAQKRVGLALEALALLARARPAVSLAIVGDGPERPALEAQAGDLGITGRVRFTGMLPPGAVRGALEAADLFVFPAEGEGLGLAAIEAVAAGVPIVGCTDGGGVLDVLREPGAGLAVPPEAEALAEAVARVLDDPGAKAAAATAGRAWQERLAPERVAERCETWYREALDG